MNATEAEVAWAAGIFEGEGCVHPHGGNKNGGILVINMTDEDVLRRFQTIVGCGSFTGPVAPTKPEHKPHYEWRVCNWLQVVEVLEAFRPWLGSRRLAKVAQLYSQPPTIVSRLHLGECVNGHPLAGPESDVHVQQTRKGTQRVCRVCRKDRAHALRVRRAAA